MSVEPALQTRRPNAPRPQSRAAGLRALFTPTFVVCAAILVIAIVGLYPTMSWVGQQFRKEGIPIRQALSAFDIGALLSFQPASAAHYLECPEGDAETTELLWLPLEHWPRHTTGAPLVLFVTYYSDPASKVPHTPDVCYRQAGSVIDGLERAELDVSTLGAEHTPVTVRIMDFTQPHTYGVLMYVFCANGEFCATRNRVRWILGMPSQRRVYFSKIEVVAYYHEREQRPVALESCKQVMREALPVLIRDHFPLTDGSAAP